MSPRFTLNKADLVSIGKSIALATIGFVLTYVVQEVLPNIDLGPQSWLIPVLTVVINAVIKFIRGN